MAEILPPTWHDRYSVWIASSQKNAPAFTLPDGRIHTTVNRRTDQTSMDIIGRAGIQAVMDTSIPDNNRRFQWTNSNIFNNSGKGAAVGTDNPASTLNQDDCKNVAHTIPLCYLEADELGEGNPWGMPYWAPQKRWYYEERKAMYEAAGKTYRNYGTYGGFENFNGDPWLFRADGNQNVLPNDQRFKSLIQTVQGARGSCAYFSMWENVNVGAIIKNYADTPDFAADYYRKKFAAEVMGRGMGRTGGIGPGRLGYLDWGKIEGLDHQTGQDLHNGFNYQRTKPDGSVRITYGLHPHIFYGWQMGCIFMIGFCLTDGYIPFDERSPVWGTNPASDDYPDEPQGWHNAGFEAAYRYSQCNRTEGQPWQPAKYRFEGSETWITPPTDFTSTLEHASAFGGPYAQGSNARRGRPDVQFRVNGSALDFACFDPSQGSHKSDTIIVQPVPNQEYRVTLKGCTLRQFRESI